MAEIVNLRTARKARTRVQAEKQAAANRARYGRNKAQRLADEAEESRKRRLLDGSRRED